VWNGLYDSATNYISVRVWDNAGSSYTITDAFNVLKDTTAPAITGSQAGDDTWRDTAGTLYDVDFADGGSLISSAAYTAWTGPGATGTQAKGWTQLPGVFGASYAADWAVDFSGLAQGYNYISVRAWDIVGSQRELADAFYVKKDTAAPVITDLQDGDTTWYRLNPGAIFDIDFADASIGVSSAAYEAWTGLNRTGVNVVPSTPIFSGTPVPSYTQDWGLFAADWLLLAPGTNYITVTAWDGLGRSSAAVDNFHIRKDTVPPSSVSTLVSVPASGQAGEGDLYARWNAPGDNDLTGGASYYMIRYKTSAFTDQADFNAAPVYVSTLTPKAAGSLEGLTLGGLTAGVTYYIAVEAADKAGNTGSLSNMTSTYAGVDLTPPGAISDLAAVMADFQGQIALTWTAPGEGVKGVANAGTPSAYIVRYAGFAINSGNFSSPLVSTFTQVWAPQAYGQAESRIVDGLTPGATYSIAIKAVDERGNTGAISNVPTSSATPAGSAAGMIVYGAGASNVPKYRNWTPETWGGQADSIAAAATVRWSVLNSVPVVTNAKVGGFLASDNSLKFLNWDGINSAWSNITPAAAPAPGGSATRKFDLAPENLTGRVMAAYYQGAVGAVSYAVWSSTASGWAGAPASLTLTGLTGAVNFVRLKSMPGTDRILLLALDANSRLSAAVWTGTAWTSVQSLTTAASIATKECFDGAWESQTGNALALWGTGTTTAYKIWRSTSSAWDPATPAGPNILAAANWIRVAADPSTNRLGMTSINATPAWNVAVWRSTLGTEAWSALPTAGTGRSNVFRITDAAWEAQSGKFMAAAVTSASQTRFSYLTWLNGTWTPASPSVATANANTTFAGNINWLALVPDPNTSKITALGTDTLGILKTTLWGGSSWAGTTASSNFQHTTGVSDLNYEPASLAFDRQDPVPPTVVDNQAGDDNWLNSRVYYNIDATDSGGSRLASVQTKVFSQANGGGTLIQDWTDQVSGINSDSHTGDWQFTQESFDLLPQGQSYVGVRARDNAGNYSLNILDAFYIKKDTMAPTVTNNLAADYDSVWRNSDQGAVYNLDFADAGGSQLRSLEYSASSGPAQTGIQTLGWTVISSGTAGSLYTADWPLSFNLLGHGTNYITVRAIDNAFSTTTLADAFKVLKDTQPPAAITGLAAAAGPVRGSINLSWTAPGDDGAANNNTGGYYVVKSATFQITSDALFAAASTYVQAWPPAAAGQPEARVLYDFGVGQTYYFAVKTADKAGNIAALPNQASSLPQVSNVYLNEVYASGATAGEDWIELYNNTASTFTLAGWTLVYDQGSIDLPGPEVTVWTGAAVDRSSVSAAFLAAPSSNLNGGQSYHVILKDAGGTVIDRVQWPALSSGRSFARITDGNADYFDVDPTPTPGYANAIATDPVKINEISYGALAGQFMELYNTGAATSTLSGYSLRGSYNGRFKFTRKIYADSYALIDQSAVSDEALPYASVFGASGLSAAGDFVVLENAAGQTLDRVVWQSGTSYSLRNYKAALVSASDWAPANAAGSIGRFPAEGYDTGHAAADFSVQAPATPASRNNGAGQAAVNSLSYPAASQVLPFRFPLRLTLGAVSSAGSGDNLVLSRTGGAADPYSPHLYRLEDIGFDLSGLSPQSTSHNGLSFPDQDGRALADGAVYKLILNSDTGAVSAPQVIRSGLVYDASIHAVNASTAAPQRLGETYSASTVRLEVYNNSPAGYNAVEIASFTVRLLDQDLAVLDTAKARNLFESVSLVKDSPSGLSGVYESGLDQDVAASVAKAGIILDGSGALTLTVPSAAAAMTPAASTAAYYVVFTAAQFASTQTPNVFRVAFSPVSDVMLRDTPSSEAQNFIPGAAVQTSSTSIIVSAAPPPGTSWPFDSGAQAGVVSPIDYYSDGLVTASAYIPALDGVLRAVKYDGQAKWEFNSSPQSAIRTSPVVLEEAGGVYLYFANDIGDIYKVKDNDISPQEIWKRQLGTAVRSNPIDSGGKLYFGAANNKVYCLNKADGSDCSGWTYDAGFTAPISGTLALDDRTPGVNASWIGLEDGKVVRFLTAYGTISSYFQTGGPIKSSPYADAAYLGGNNLYVTSTDGKLYSRTSANLTTLPADWTDYDSGSPIYTSPFKDLANEKYIYFGNDAGRLYKVDAASGTLVLSFQAGGPIKSSPVMVPADFCGLAAGEDYVYFGSDDGYIYAVNTHTGQLRSGWPVATGGPVRADLVVDIANLTLMAGSSDGKTYVLYIGP